MKKATLLAILSVMGLLAQSAWATIDFTVTNPSQNVSAGSGTFTETLQLSVTQSSSPANVASYDAIFEALQSQNGGIANGQFQVTNATPPPSEPNWQDVNPGGFPDSLTLVGSDHAGFVQSSDEGFSNSNTTQNVSTPLTNFQLATYTFSYSGLTAGQTYNFQTTLQSTSASKFSDVHDASGSTFNADSRAMFSITVPVPEPATWSLFGLGTLGSLGLNFLRARRKSS